ncbi:hypothetical protein FRB94_012674 [Tulasnella sp. JGI-2019a]|nr:hypothetical protein FRB94_012674 [Tulasnella sp. JGI-2019a]
MCSLGLLIQSSMSIIHMELRSRYSAELWSHRLGSGGAYSSGSTCRRRHPTLTSLIKFRGYVLTVLLVTSSPGRKEAERGVVVNSDSGRVAKVIEGLDTSWSSTSVFLDRQLVDALKMSEAYGVLAEEGKEGEEGVVVTSMSHHRSYHTSPLLGLGVLILH